MSQESDSLFLKALNNLSDSPGQASLLADTILNRAQLTNNVVDLGNAHFIKGKLCFADLKYTEAEKYFTNSKEQYLASGDSTLTVSNYMELAETYYMLFVYQKAINCLNEALLYLKNENEDLALKVNILKIKCFLGLNKPLKALQVAQEPLLIGADKLEANNEAKFYIGNAYLELQNYDTAFVYLNLSLNGFKEENNNVYIAKVYSLFADAFYYWGNIKYALEFYYNALEKIENSKEIVSVLTIYRKIAQTYLSGKDFDLAKKYIVNSLSLAEEYNFLFGVGYGNLVLGDISFNQGEHRKAFVEYQKACAILESFANIDIHAACVIKLSEFYLNTDQHKDLKEYVEKLTMNLPQIEGRLLLQAIDILRNYYINYDNIEKYIEYNNNYNQVHNQYFNVLSYQELIESHLKGMNNVAHVKLKEKQEEISKIRAEIRLQKWIIMLLVFSTAAIFVFLIMLFRFYRVNKKATKQLVRKNQEINESREELLLAKEKAEESDKLKSSFLANMSHEIRTPMNSIIGFSNLLGREDLELDKRQKYLGIVERNGRNLVNLIDDIIDLSKLESKQLELRPEECEINDELKHLFRFYSKEKHRENRAHIQLRLVLPKTGRLKSITTDGIRLKQVLSNLLSNAIKFTEKGAIEFGYYVEGEQIKFYVQDTGIGIAPESKSLIFKRFRQVDESINREYGGAGLGLTLSMGLVELLGGNIWFESEINKGTIFYFTIGLHDAVYLTEEEIEVDDASIEAKEYKWPERCILIAEDEDENFILIEEILSETQLKIYRAKNGIEAVNLCLEKDEIDLVLMDIKMPVMNGYEATSRIKQNKPGIPIIAQTAFALSDEQNKCIMAGCNNYISKPIKPHELLESLSQYFDH